MIPSFRGSGWQSHLLPVPRMMAGHHFSRKNVCTFLEGCVRWLTHVEELDTPVALGHSPGPRQNSMTRSAISFMVSLSPKATRASPVSSTTRLSFQTPCCHTPGSQTPRFQDESRRVSLTEWSFLLVGSKCFPLTARCSHKARIGYFLHMSLRCFFDELPGYFHSSRCHAVTKKSNAAKTSVVLLDTRS